MGSVSLTQGIPSPYQVFSAPAALGFVRTVEAGVGVVYMDPRLRPFGTLVLNSNGTLGEFNSAGVLPGGGQLLAMAFPLGKERPLTLAGTVFLPFSSLIRVSGSPVNYPFYPLYTDVSRNFFYIVGAGYEFAEGWAAGMNFRATTKSSTVYQLRSDNTVNYSASATEARGVNRFSASVVYDHARKNPERPFSLGAMYRAKAGLETKIAADVTAFVPIQGQLVSFPAYSPAEWVLMGSVRAWDRWIFSADAAWVLWGAYQSPYGTGNLNSYVIPEERPAGFKDIPVLRFGVDRASPQNGRWVQRISYRAGYVYHPSPVPDQVGESNYVDNDRHVFSVGLGIGIRNPWRGGQIDLDLFCQYNWLKEREVRKLAATSVGAPGYRTGGKILIYGTGATFRF